MQTKLSNPATPLSYSPFSGTTTRLLRLAGVILAQNILRCCLVVDHSSANLVTVMMKKNPTGNERSLTILNKFNGPLVGTERVKTFLMLIF
jgi:hypothetical protein